jgi:hypothetical protein
MKSITGSCRGSSVLPLRRGFRSEDPQRLPEDEITLNVEVVEQGGMHTEKALGRSSRFEALHLALSSSYHLVRVLARLFCAPCQGALFSPGKVRAGKLSLQPEALGADQEATNGLKHSEKRPLVEVSGPCGPQRE